MQGVNTSKQGWRRFIIRAFFLLLNQYNFQNPFFACIISGATIHVIFCSSVADCKSVTAREIPVVQLNRDFLTGLLPSNFTD